MQNSSAPPPPTSLFSSSSRNAALAAHILSFLRTDKTSLEALTEAITALKPTPVTVASALWLGYEHHRFHLSVLPSDESKKFSLPLVESEASKRFRTLVEFALRANLTTQALLQELLPREACITAQIGAIPEKADKRARTRRWYTQGKYNLLREEPQGFSRLIALVGNAGAPDATKDAVVSLIGAYSLDPNRVLDVVLGEAERWVQMGGGMRGEHIRSDLEQLLRLGPKDHLATILGFRLQSFQERTLKEFRESKKKVPATRKAQGQGDAPQGQDTTGASRTHGEEEKDHSLTLITPDSLLGISALLIRDNLVNLDDVFPYLAPYKTEELVAIERTYYEKLNKATKSISAVNLSTAKTNNPLLTGTAQALSEDHILQSELVRSGPFCSPSLQKVHLLPVLLRLGCWGAFRSLVNRMGSPSHALDVSAHPPVARELSALISVAIDRAVVRACADGAVDCAPADRAGIPDPQVRNTYMQALGEAELSRMPPLLIRGIGSQHEFLGPEGAEIRKCLLMLGAHARCNLDLLFSLCRLLRGNTGKETVKILREVVLPACALCGSNVALGMELWETLKPFPYHVRYELYQHLDLNKTKEYPLIAAASAQTTYNIKQTLKRLSNDNHKHFGRTIAKLTHGNALPVAAVMIDSVQNYPNQIMPLVDSLKFISPLSLDMFVFQLLKKLGSCIQEKLKRDGLNLAQWYSSTCTFVASLGKKFFDSIDFSPILNFIYNELVNEDMLTVNLISEILTHVGSVPPLPTMGVPQVLMSVSGGGLRSLPQDLGLTNLLDKRAAEKSEKVASSLRLCLSETGLRGDIGIAIARTKELALVKEGNLKVASGIHDRVQKVLLQYSSFCNGGVGVGIGLLIKLGVSTDSAFMLERNSLNYLEMINDAEQKSSTDAKMAEAGELDGALLSEEAFASNKAVFNKMSRLERAFWWNGLTEFGLHEASGYVTLEKVYLSEIERVEQAEKMCMLVKDATATPIKKRFEAKENMERFAVWKSRLREELEACKVRSSSILEAMKSDLQQESRTISQEGSGSRREEVLVNFLQRCILPRVTASKADAIYCARFVAVTESMMLEQWSLKLYYSHILSLMGGLSFSCSEGEASGLSLFYSEILLRLEVWRRDPSGLTYEKDVGARWDDGKPVTFKDWCKWLYSVHEKIVEALAHALDGSGDLEVRNALVMLNGVSESFPRVTKHAVKIEKALEDLKKSPRKDIKLMASSYHARLKAKGKNLLDDEGSFCHTEKPKALTHKSVPSASPNGEYGPKPGILNISKSKLNPHAAEFVPASTVPTSSTAKAIADRRKDVKVRGRGDVRANVSSPHNARSSPVLAERRSSPEDLGKRTRSLEQQEAQSKEPSAKRMRREPTGQEGREKSKRSTPSQSPSVRGRRESDPRAAFQGQDRGGHNRDISKQPEGHRESVREITKPGTRQRDSEKDHSREVDRGTGRGRETGRERARDRERDRERAHDRDRRERSHAQERSDQREGDRGGSADRQHGHVNGPEESHQELFGRRQLPSLPGVRDRVAHDRANQKQSGREHHGRATSRDYSERDTRDSNRQQRQQRAAQRNGQSDTGKENTRKRSPRSSPRDQRTFQYNARQTEHERQYHEPNRLTNRRMHTKPRSSNYTSVNPGISGGYNGDGRGSGSSGGRSIGGQGSTQGSARGRGDRNYGHGRRQFGSSSGSGEGRR